MVRKTLILLAVALLVAAVPAFADDQVAEPGISTPLLFTDGAATQSESGAMGFFDVAAGRIGAEVFADVDTPSADASASVWADFMVGGTPDGQVDAKIFVNAGWKGAWQADAEGTTATAKITARLLQLGESEPVLIAVTTVAAAGVSPSSPPCSGCYGMAIPEVGEASIEFDRPLEKGTLYRVAFQIDVEAAGAGDAEAFMDFLNEIPETDGGGVAFSGLGISLEDDIDLGDEFAAINAKLDALAEQIAEGFEMTNQRFDAVDAQLVLTNMKLDALAEDVSEVDEKLDMVLEQLEAVMSGIMQLRMVTCDLERLVMTPEGLRASEVMACEDQPGFPYDWPEPPLSHPGNGNGNGNNPDSSTTTWRVPRGRR